MLNRDRINIYYLAIRKRFYLALKKRYVLKKRFGGILLLDIFNYVDRQVEAYGRYEPEQNKFFLDTLSNNNCQIFIDVGAHWGYYSLQIALDKRFPKVDIHAFEPDPVNRAQLFSNIFLNRLTNRINVHAEGVSNKSGTVGFHVHDDENRGRSGISEHANSVINVCSLDDRVSYINHTIGIKIDVEGHEIATLEGMVRLLETNRCILQIESFEETAPTVSTFMNSHGYNIIHKIGNDHYFMKP